MRQQTSPRPPLYLDLDGTLSRTDTLHEACLGVLKSPRSWIPCLSSLVTGGKAAFKETVGAHAGLDAAKLCYREELVEWVRQERLAGRKVYLATGADRLLAGKVAEHLQLNGCLASDGAVNLTGRAKLEAIRRHSGGRFSYAGNDDVDLPLFEAAETVVLASGAALRHGERLAGKTEARFPDAAVGIGPVVRLLRPHQWAKNILVFLPALAAHNLSDHGVLAACALIFAGFSICASGVYVANDLLDLASDRSHHEKRHRPIASGKVPIPLAAMLAVALPVAGIAVACACGMAAALMVAGYWTASSYYSFVGKRVPLLDVFLLAGLYSFRALAGSIPVETGISAWMVAFLLFLFLALACVKRHTELHLLAQKGGGGAPGRGYMTADRDLIAMFGVAASFAATLVVCLYTSSAAVAVLYPRASYLMGIAPLVLYGLCRFWMLSWRGRLSGDPVLFAIKDPVSYLLFLAAIGLAAVASRV